MRLPLDGSRHLQWDQQTGDDHLTESSHFLTVMDGARSDLDWGQYDQPNHFSPPLAHDAYVEESHPRGDANLGVIVPVSEIGVPKNTNSNILAEDRVCVNLSADELALRRNCRLTVILGAIRSAIDHCCCLDDIRLCPKIQELWIRMIEEGDPAEDMWLWVDGDEEWLQNSGLATAFFEKWGYASIRKGEWVGTPSSH